MTLLLEHWKPITGYEGLYEISNVGRVRRIGGTGGSKAGRILRQRTNNMGYFVVDLCRNALKQTRLVHRLVADAFLGNRPADKPFTNHKDATPSWNRASNLEFCTHEENMAHAQRLRRFAHGKRHRLAKLDDEKVRSVRALQGTRRIRRLPTSWAFAAARSPASSTGPAGLTCPESSSPS